MCHISKIIVASILYVFASSVTSLAADNSACNPYTEKEVNLIRASNNPCLIMGAGMLSLALNPASTVGQDFLSSSERIESPKGAATATLIIFELSHGSSLSSFRRTVERLLQDDKKNALPYYLKALLSQEEGRDRSALALINMGNTIKFDGYSRQRFNSMVDAAGIVKCEGTLARQYAIANTPITIFYVKLRHMCRKLIENNGQEAKDACLIMGQNLQKGSLTCIEQVNSLNIQKNSLDDIPENAIARLMIVKEIDRAIACGEERPLEISTSDISKDVDIKYYEIFFQSGEAAAQDFLVNYLNAKQKGTSQPVEINH